MLQGWWTHIAGANMGYRKKCFDTISSFKPGFAIPDMELILSVAEKAGFRFGFIRLQSIVTHDQRRGNFDKILQHANSDHSSIRSNSEIIFADTLTRPHLFSKSSVLLLVVSPIIALVKTIEIFWGNRNL